MFIYVVSHIICLYFRFPYDFAMKTIQFGGGLWLAIHSAHTHKHTQQKMKITWWCKYKPEMLKWMIHIYFNLLMVINLIEIFRAVTRDALVHSSHVTTIIQRKVFCTHSETMIFIGIETQRANEKRTKTGEKNVTIFTDNAQNSWHHSNLLAFFYDYLHISRNRSLVGTYFAIKSTQIKYQ